MIVERIAAFMARPDPPAFDRLALDAFAYQYEHIGPYRALCDRQGADPAQVKRWHRVPPVPAMAFRTLVLAAGEPREIFRSGESTDASMSTHPHPFPDLYRTAIESSFPSACIAPLRQPPILSLVPPWSEAPHSSLAFTMDHVHRALAATDSLMAGGTHGVDRGAARSFLAARQRDRRPTLILGTAIQLEQLLSTLERLDLRFRLPAGSRVVAAADGAHPYLAAGSSGLASRLEERLGISAEAVVQQYGPNELTSRCYTSSELDADRDLFLPPPWMRVRILDPETLQEAPAGDPGLTTAFDLANVGSAVHLVTEDLGLAEGAGFRLLGRATAADLRQCARLVEEMTA